MEDDLIRICQAYVQGRSDLLDFKKALQGLLREANHEEMKSFAEVILAGLANDLH